MAGTGISIRYRLEDADVRAAVARMARTDFEAMLREMGDHLVSTTTKRFRDGKGPDGTPWEPSQRALATGGKTLVDRGHLRDSITRVVRRGRLEVGTDLVYGAPHQFGIGRRSSLKSRRVMPALPARPFLGLSETDDRPELDRIIRDNLTRVIGGRP